MVLKSLLARSASLVGMIITPPPGLPPGVLQGWALGQRAVGWRATGGFVGAGPGGDNRPRHPPGAQAPAKAGA